MSVQALIAGKSIVQVDGRRDARSLWLGVGCILCLVSSELTLWGQCIKTPRGNEIVKRGGNSARPH